MRHKFINSLLFAIFMMALLSCKPKQEQAYKTPEIASEEVAKGALKSSHLEKSQMQADRNISRSALQIQSLEEERAKNMAIVAASQESAKTSPQQVIDAETPKMSLSGYYFYQFAGYHKDLISKAFKNFSCPEEDTCVADTGLLTPPALQSDRSPFLCNAGGEVVFSFKENKLSGTSCHTSYEYWSEAFDDLNKNLGEPKLDRGRFGQMLTTIAEWRHQGIKITLAKYSGRNINNEIIDDHTLHIVLEQSSPPNITKQSVDATFSRPGWCKAAKLPHELVICGDSVLSSNEIKILDLYSNYRKSSFSKNSGLEKQQRLEYFERAKNCKTNRECLLMVQNERIEKYTHIKN